MANQINVARLQQELDFLLDHPDRHKQDLYTDLRNVAGYLNRSVVERAADTSWQCNTRGCLAGWTAIHAGWQPSIHDNFLIHPDNPVMSQHASVIAQDLLGLTSDQADQLFSGTNSLFEMYELAAGFTNGAIRMPHPAWLDEDGFPVPAAERKVRELQMEGESWAQADQAAGWTEPDRSEQPNEVAQWLPPSTGPMG
jgi:hypothetical protein